MHRFRNDHLRAAADDAGGGDEKARLITANAEFYAAFTAMDMAAMEAVWSTADEIAVIHPGWGRLIGRDAVMEAWQNMFDAVGVPAYLQILDPRAIINANAAFVICTEDLGAATLIATNIFVSEDGQWRLVHHQSGPTQASAPEGRLN
jgi:ketosteroid isomerase-like protein